MQYYGALEAGGTKMVCAIGDETGKIIARVSIPTQTPEQTMPPMIDFFRQYPIRALGIGCFGPVDLDKKSPTYGYITTTPKLPWQNYDIVGEFHRALQVPVGFDTDVNAAALGEATWGCTRGLDHSIYITVGTGIGVGVIAGGKPYHGMLHPEGGHIPLAIHPDDPMKQGICPYHPNCLEGLAAGPSLQARWGRKGVELTDRPEVWALEAHYLGQALMSYILILSPQRIVLGGGVMKQPSLLSLVRRETMAQLNRYVQGKGLEDPETYIVAPSLDDNQGILGALKLAMDAEEAAE